MTYIGRPVRPLDWDERTSGRTRYAADLEFEGLVFGRILRSPWPLARIASIDTSRALAMPGVRAIVTAQDFPAGARYFHEGARDRPPLADGLVRFIGQEVAAVAADTTAQAEAALLAIEVRYIPLAAPTTVADALLPDSARLHERPEKEHNVARAFRRLWGDADAGRKASTHSVGGRYSYPRVSHACMEPNTTVAYWDETGSRMHLWASTQAPFYVRKEVAGVLGLDQAQVICHEVAVGGGFGAKSKVCEHEAIAALLARASGRPVLLALTREEEFFATKSRHAFAVDLRLHGDAEGQLRAIESAVVVENGAYNHSGVSVMAAGIKAFGMLYRPQGIDVQARLVDTATVPGGSFRGYGSTQTGFALECLLDELADQTGCDPLDLRIRNANQPGDRTLIGAKLESVRLVECLEAVRKEIAWDRERTCRVPGRGVGVAVGVHPSGAFTVEGSNRSDCAIDIHLNGRIQVRFGGSDAGTGQKTILAQIVAHELGVPLSTVHVLSMDSEKTPYDQGAWSSRGTHYSGHAASLAAREAASCIRKLAQEVLGTSDIVLADGFACGNGQKIPIGSLTAENPDAKNGVWTLERSFVDSRVERGHPETGIGNYSASYNFAAHAAVVEIDRRTGRIRILDYVAAHDVGVAINPLFVEGQIAGGVAMGIGAALGEQLVLEQGRVVNPAYVNYALPRAADLPRIRSVLIQGADPNGPYGAKAVGELGVNPPASVISNAVYNAIGIRFRDLPITPDKVLRAIAEKEGRHRDHSLWRRPGRWWTSLVRAAYPLGLLRRLHLRQAPLPVIPDRSPVASLEFPENLDAARRSLGPDARPLAGGTEIHLLRRQGLLRAGKLVCLRDLKDLEGIQSLPDGTLRVGAGVTLIAAGDKLSRTAPMVSEAVRTIASEQVRAVATVGGNLLQEKRCWFYRNDFPCYKRRGGLAPCYAVEGDHRFHHAVIDGHRCQAVTPSDLATVFLALDAQLEIEGPGGRRTLPMQSLYRGPGESTLGERDLLVAITFSPGQPGRKSAFEKLRLWEGDFALVSIAIAADIESTGTWRKVRIALGGMATVPWRAVRTEAALEGTVPNLAFLRSTLDRELDAAAHPLARNGWKLDAAAGLAERAFERMTSGDPVPGN